MNWARMAIAASVTLSMALCGCQTTTPDASAEGGEGQAVLARDPMAPRGVKLAEPAPPTAMPGARERAIDLLLQATEANDPLLRANAIEALHHAPQALAPAVRRALADPNEGVRFVAAMTVGRKRLASLAEAVEPLLNDDSGSVRAAAIYALRRCGRSIDLNPLAEMIRSGDPTMKGNAAMILGELGNPSAVPMLQEAVGRTLPRTPVARTKIVDLQIAEALVKLGHEGGLDAIRAALFAPVEQGELTVLACQMCGQLADKAYAPSLRDMATREGRLEEPPEIQLAAAEALARMDRTWALPHIPLAHVGSDRPALRAQAAITLGSFPATPRTLEVLAGLLADTDPTVQVAAAGAVVRLTGR
ncbi:MAG: HEAT repeat domain-containing protein [Planctomycetota bacterium]|nr:HEAT repeat domain-containing protein [Planctomycetota bacterium]